MPTRRTTRDERPAHRRSASEDREPYDEESDEAAYDEAEPADEDQAGADQDESAASRPRARGAGNRQGAGRVTAAQAAEAGMTKLVELIGKHPEGVTAVEPTDDGWLVGVEVLEDQRVPSSADVLAIYEAELDPDGELLSYRRTARYSRGRGDSPRDA